MFSHHDVTLVTACSLFACAAVHAVPDDRSVASEAVVTDRGTETVAATGSSLAPAVADAPPPQGGIAGAGTVLWTRNTGTAIAMTAGLSLDAGVASGTSLNPPQEVALHELEGDGTPVWNSVGEDYRSAAAAHADVVAGVDLVADGVVVRKWTGASATPDWEHAISNVGLSTYQSIAVSDDGSTIAVLVSIPNGGGARMNLYDSSSSTPVAAFESSDGSVGRNIVVSTDGSFAAFRIAQFAYVWDRAADDLRAGLNTGAATDPITISDDGQFIAYGFTNVTVQQWNGVAYATHWTRSPPSSILRQCAISADGSTVVTAWSSFGGTDPFVEVHDVDSNVPDWTYDYPGAGGELQDIPSAVEITDDGGHFAVSSWGNEGNFSPQIHLFERGSSAPLMTEITPGSMFDVNIAEAGNGTIYVSASGKHVHANTFGNGGDVYALRYGDVADCPEDVDGSGAVDVVDLVAVILAWGPCLGCAEDTNGDDMVDVIDLVNVILAWGPC